MFNILEVQYFLSEPRKFLAEAVLMCAHYLSGEQNCKNEYQNFSIENYHFALQNKILYVVIHDFVMKKCVCSPFYVHFDKKKCFSFCLHLDIKVGYSRTGTL